MPQPNVHKRRAARCLVELRGELDVEQPRPVYVDARRRRADGDASVKAGRVERHAVRRVDNRSRLRSRVVEVAVPRQGQRWREDRRTNLQVFQRELVLPQAQQREGIVEEAIPLALHDVVRSFNDRNTRRGDARDV